MKIENHSKDEQPHEIHCMIMENICIIDSHVLTMKALIFSVQSNSSFISIIKYIIAGIACKMQYLYPFF